MKYGAVSHQTRKCRGFQNFGADIGAAITGIAGPGGGDHENLWGLYMAITGLTDTQTRELCLGGKVAYKIQVCITSIKLVEAASEG